jgi:hypothetical protein
VIEFYRRLDMSDGYVYVFASDDLPDKVKIGHTIDVAARLKNASTWTPSGFDCLYALHSDRHKEVEGFVHIALKYCCAGGVFFQVSVDAAIELLQGLEKLGLGTSVPGSFYSGLGTVPVTVGKVRQERTTFSKVDVPVGSKLEATWDPGITCITTDDTNQVEYDGKKYSISGLACEKRKYSVNGFQCFTFNGQLLWDIRLAKSSSQLNLGLVLPGDDEE